VFVFLTVAGVAGYFGIENRNRLHYEMLYRERAEGLRRAEQLAMAQTPVQLEHASALTDQFLRDVTDGTDGSPQGIHQSTLVSYLSGNQRLEVTEKVATAYFLRARISELQSRAADQDERQRLHAAALEFNAQSEPWFVSLGNPELPRWQRQVLNTKDLAKDILSLLDKPWTDLGPRQRVMRIALLLDAERLGEALILTRRVVDQHPGWGEGWFFYGLVKARAGNFPEALHGFDTAVALEPDNPVALHYRAKVRTNLHDFEGALADYAQALQGGLARVDILADRALVRLARSEFQMAQADLDAALRLEPASTRLYFLRSQAKRAVGDAAGAQVDRAQGLAQEPRDPLGFIARGLARREERDWSGALADFASAEKLFPSSLPALENQAQILGEELHKPAEALAVLNRAVKAVPEAPLLYTSRAVYHARLGHRDQALHDVETALKLGPLPSPLTLYHVGCVYALSSKAVPSDVNQAIVYLTSALERGFGKQYLQTDTDLDGLRQHEEFRRLVARFSSK
jgi:tetratricopeptide (TPR) repeat protein